MVQPIRIGVIGVGLIGKHHLENYEKIDGANVVALADVNEPEAQRVSEKFHVPSVYTDFRELLQRDDIDAVDVCLHNNFHAPVTIEALQAGKHVYCEKPLAGAYADGKAMVDMAESCNKMLHIQLANLYQQETRMAKHLIDEGKLGKLYHARSTGYRRRGRPFVDGYGSKFFVSKETAAGGALYDMGVYHISQMLYLLGLPKVRRISGKVYQETAMDEARREESHYNVEELALGFVKFDNNVVLDIIESWAVHLNEFEGSYVVGSEGGVRLTPFSYHTTMNDIDVDATMNSDAVRYRWHQLRKDEDAYDSSQHHWIAALQGRVPLLPTSQLALETMLISEGIYLSDKLGREVSEDEVLEMSKSTAIRLEKTVR